MAEQKRKPGRPPGSKNKKSNAKSIKSVKKEAPGNGVRDDIVAVILIAVGIFLVVAFQTSAAGEVGTALAHFFKGCFGFAAFILPYYFILYGVLLFAKKTIHVGIKSIILLIVIFLMISLINSARFIDPVAVGNGFDRFAFYYNNGMVLDDGGAFGMIAGGLIVKLLGIPGLYIFAFLVIFVCLLLLMNTPVSRFLEEVKEKKKQRAVQREERIKEKEKQKLERQMEMMLPRDEQQPGYDSGINERQRKIMGYVKEENFSLKNGFAEEKPQLDFSLGEKEEKPKRKTRVKTIKEPTPDRETKTDKGPIIAAVPVTEPVSAEEALQDDFNVQIISGEDYEFPSINLLKKGNSSNNNNLESESSLRSKALKLEETLHSFNIDAKVTNVTQGPAVTRYEVHPNSGVKVKGIKNLADDIALNMEAKSIRIEAPIPGKPAVGIEIENDRINMVTIREIIDSMAFKKAESKISFAVGKDIAGKAIVADLKSMPHLLIAGSTGSGKSVCINSIIASFLYKARPDEVKLVLIDPKVVELANYNGIPHLLIPVVTEPAKAAAALNWAVGEMDERYRKFAEEGVRELASYNKTIKKRGDDELIMPQIVIIIDELADLMMAAPSQVEESICRLAQKARAAGMHLIVATQRPSVDVITGVIKANIPSRIAFAVSSMFDSRTILDMAGAEKLVGKGDMLFNPLGTGKPVRVQGSFISDGEVHQIIDFVKKQVDETEYAEHVIDSIERANTPASGKNEKDPEDELLVDAIELVVQAQQASVSMLQRRFRIGYNRAARIIDMMEDRQIIGPSDGSRPRQVLISEDDLINMNEELEDFEE
ncbi:MAG: DNA translocase FtsK [Clostridiales bacterium]|nr:DNA translocase FtsK [Clostridiales bacterium]